MDCLAAVDKIISTWLSTSECMAILKGEMCALTSLPSTKKCHRSPEGINDNAYRCTLLLRGILPLPTEAVANDDAMCEYDNNVAEMRKRLERLLPYGCITPMRVQPQDYPARRLCLSCWAQGTTEIRIRSLCQQRRRNVQQKTLVIHWRVPGTQCGQLLSVRGERRIISGGGGNSVLIKGVITKVKFLHSQRRY